MSQGGAQLRCRTGLSTGLASRVLFQVAVPFVASLAAHAAVVAAFTGRGAVPPAVSPEPPADWVEAPEPVNMEPVAPAQAEEGADVPAPPEAQPRVLAADSPSGGPPALVNLPPPDAVPGAHAGPPLSDKERAAWWAAARKTCVGFVNGRDCYGAIRAQVAGWNPKVVTGTYVPGAGIVHATEMPSRRVPAAVIGSILQANMDRFRVCHGAGLPKSAMISGQVLVTFVIDLDGHVSGPRDTGGRSPTTPSASASCVR